MIADWTFLPQTDGGPAAFLVLGTISVMLIGIAKGGFGGSIGLLSTPIMIAACGGDAKLAMGIMLPLLIACDQVSLVKWWGRWDLRVIKLLLGGAILGIAGGGVALWYLERHEASGQKPIADASLTFTVGAVAICFIIVQALRSLRSKPLPFRPVLWQGSCFGVAAGFISTLTHGAGPITSMYLLPQQMTKEKYVASTVLYYWIGNLLKVPVYVYFQRVDGAAVKTSALLVPGVIVGTLLGVYLHHRVGQKHFNVIIYSLLALAAGYLIYMSAPALWG